MTASDDDSALARLVDGLRASTAVADKAQIHAAYEPGIALAGRVRLGDDCAAIPDGDGYLLLAAEGMLEGFVADDPWFAGYSAVMVNLSDVAAMGGWPLAMVDILWTPDRERCAEIWEGISAASTAYGVPIVGGHTTRSAGLCLGAAVLGRARRLITSFDALPGDDLLMAVDLRGSYRGDKPFWNASVEAPAERLRDDLQLLVELANCGLCRAGKDISNGGIVGTLIMLLECSGVGAELALDLIPMPDQGGLHRWLRAFPSYGFLLCARPEAEPAISALFRERDLACVKVGRITESPCLVLTLGRAKTTFWRKTPPAAEASGHRATFP